MTDITAKIASVLSAAEVALNVGSNEGVEVDDAAFIYETVEIRDPDTKEILGEVKRRKLDLRITGAQAKLSIAIVTENQEIVRSGAATVRRRKKITDDPNEEKKGEIVLVSIGDLVIIRRESKPAAEEPPF